MPEKTIEHFCDNCGINTKYTYKEEETGGNDIEFCPFCGDSVAVLLNFEKFDDEVLYDEGEDDYQED